MPGVRTQFLVSISFRVICCPATVNVSCVKEPFLVLARSHRPVLYHLVDGEQVVGVQVKGDPGVFGCFGQSVLPMALTSLSRPVWSFASAE